MRSNLAGWTDYSHQSIDDMRLDLEKWKVSLNETLTKIKDSLSVLEKTAYWRNFDYDFCALTYNAKKMYETALKEISEVIQGIDNEVQDYHVKMIRSIGHQGTEYYRAFGQTWHRGEVNKDYGDPLFDRVEQLYAEARNTAADLIDLDNLGARLQDFIGRKGNGVQPMVQNITNNFNAPIGAVQQNYDNSQGIQNTGGHGEFEEIKTLISDVKCILATLPQKERTEVEENLAELSETIENENPKPNRIKAFTGAIGQTLRKVLSMNTLNNAVELSEKVPKILDGIEEISNKL